MAEPGPLEAHLRARREAGRKLLIPYLTGGAYVAPAIIDAGGGQQILGDSINYVFQRVYSYCTSSALPKVTV